MKKYIMVRRVAALFAALCVALLCTVTAFADDVYLEYRIDGIKNGQTDVSKSPTITLTFSESVVGSTVKENNINSFSLTDSNSAEVPIDVKFPESSNSLYQGKLITVSPKSDLTPGMSYVFTIKDTVTSDSGHRVYSGERVSFTVATGSTTTTTTTTTAKANVSITTTTSSSGSPGSGSSAGTTSRQATAGSAVTSAPAISTRIARSVRGRPSSGGSSDKTTKAERTTRETTTRETTTRETTTRMPETVTYTRPETTTRYIPETTREIIRPTTGIFEETYPEAEEDTGYTYDYRTEAYYEPSTQVLETVPQEYPGIEKYYKEEEPTADNSALPFVIIAEVALIALPVAGLLYLLKRKASAGGAEEFIPQEEAAEGQTEETKDDSPEEPDETAEEPEEAPGEDEEAEPEETGEETGSEETEDNTEEDTDEDPDEEPDEDSDEESDEDPDDNIF